MQLGIVGASMDYFIAIDVETANRNRGSICQIGLVCFSRAEIEWQWSTLVDPEGAFESGNVGIHGITPEHVKSAPKWPVVLDCIADSIKGQVIASHTNFDEFALKEASERYGVKLPNARWIDSHALARKAWPTMARHGLAELCQVFDIELDHHDALSDAMACGRIVNLSLRPNEMSPVELEARISRMAATKPRRSSRFRLAGHQRDIAVHGAHDGPLKGHVVVLTGEFDGGKGPLAALAASVGCDVEPRFTKSRTTILVLGQRNSEVRDDGKSSKQRSAEDAIAEGRAIEILTEEEFRRLLERVSSEDLKAAV